MARKWPEFKVIVNPPTPEQALAMCEAVVPIMAEILRPHWAEICKPVAAKETEAEQEEKGAA
jgi:hypothetical protein